MAENGIPVRWVFWLAATVISVAVVAVVIAVFIPPSDASIEFSILRYRIIIALTCFVLSSISALLFAAKVEVKASLGLFSLGIVGPAAMWIAALLIFNYTMPEELLFRQPSSEEAAEWIRWAEESGGWLQYDPWRDRLGNTISVIEEDEEYFISFLLPRVYYHGHHVSKLRDPKIETLFVYTEKVVLKFQRIWGHRINDIPPDVYMSAVASMPGGRIDPYYFVRRNRQIIHAEKLTLGSWNKITFRPIDCLLISIYYDDILPSGDWIYIDVGKYRDRAHSGAGELMLGVWSTREISDFQIWEIAPTQLVNTTPAPLLFREISSALHTEGEVPAGLYSWIEILDEYMLTSKDEVPPRSFLNKILDVLKTDGLNLGSFSDLLKHESLLARQYYEISGPANDIFAAFLWETYLSRNGRVHNTKSRESPNPALHADATVPFTYRDGLSPMPPLPRSTSPGCR